MVEWNEERALLVRSQGLGAGGAVNVHLQGPHRYAPTGAYQVL